MFLVEDSAVDDLELAVELSRAGVGAAAPEGRGLAFAGTGGYIFQYSVHTYIMDTMDRSIPIASSSGDETDRGHLDALLGRDFDLARAYKHAMPIWTREIACALHRSIVFAGFVVEFDAAPFALGERSRPDESDGPRASLGDCHPGIERDDRSLIGRVGHG
jgi:hypothetical protein